MCKYCKAVIDALPVNYCPMCGRDLRNEKSNFGWSSKFDLDMIPADLRKSIREHAEQEERAYREMIEKYKAHLRIEIARMEVEIGNAEVHRALASVPKPRYIQDAMFTGHEKISPSAE